MAMTETYEDDIDDDLDEYNTLYTYKKSSRSEIDRQRKMKMRDIRDARASRACRRARAQRAWRARRCCCCCCRCKRKPAQRCRRHAACAVRHAARAPACRQRAPRRRLRREVVTNASGARLGVGGRLIDEEMRRNAAKPPAPVCRASARRAPPRQETAGKVE